MPDIWASHALQQSYRELPEAQVGSDPTLNLCSYSHTNKFNALHQHNVFPAQCLLTPVGADYAELTLKQFLMTRSCM